MDKFTQKTIEECKGVLKHSWYTEPQTSPEPRVIQINNRCERGCGTTRHMKVDLFGNQLSPWRYKYIEGYKQITAESMTEWRRLYIKRLTTKRRKAS